MTAENLASMVGVILSLGFSYIPGLNTKFARLEGEHKRLIMAGILVDMAGGAFGLNGTDWCACTNCSASGSHAPPLMALPATTAWYAARSFTSSIGNTSTVAPFSARILPNSSATPAVAPKRLKAGPALLPNRPGTTRPQPRLPACRLYRPLKQLRPTWPVWQRNGNAQSIKFKRLLPGSSWLSLSLYWLLWRGFGVIPKPCAGAPSRVIRVGMHPS
jgi:hypothetical protein